MKAIDLKAIDNATNGPDGLRDWTWGYDDDGGLGAQTDELVENLVGIVERAQTIVSIVKRRGLDVGVRKFHGHVELTTIEIRKIVDMLVRECD
jgi:hypothetical protein